MKMTIASKFLGSDDSEIQFVDVKPLEIVEGDASRLANLADKKSVHAERCIYCGSREGLTDEHVIPYAWGGNLKIFDGSCAQCQRETQLFENFALNDGVMTSVRKVRGIQSRSGHKSVPSTIPVTLVKNDGRQVVEEISTDSAPLMLGFPWFPLPGVIEGSSRSTIDLTGWLTAAVGADVEKFLKEHDAKEMRSGEDRKQPVAFARAIAKIAYCYAWLDGVFEYVGGSGDLVHTFMHDPAQLGAFVGMKPQPFERFCGMDFRLLYKLEQPDCVYMEVQPFPDIPAPTYLVVLGFCANVRGLRKTRSRVSKGLVPMKSTERKE